MVIVDDEILEDDEVIQLSIEVMDNTAVILANPIIDVTIIDMDGKNHVEILCLVSSDMLCHS